MKKFCKLILRFLNNKVYTSASKQCLPCLCSNETLVKPNSFIKRIFSLLPAKRAAIGETEGKERLGSGVGICVRLAEEFVIGLGDRS